MTDNKEHISIAVAGHVDAGKSTTTGHLCFDLGGIDEREMKELQKEADALGKGSFAFAFWMDKTKAERERGVTIETTTKEFFTDSKHYTILDTPGHRKSPFYFVSLVFPKCVSILQLFPLISIFLPSCFLYFVVLNNFVFK